MAKTSFQQSGSLLGLVLAVLEETPLHGYGIAREIERRSADALTFGEGTLYPALRTLEQRGLIAGTWDTVGEHGPARKVYRLKPEGLAELQRVRAEWHEYSRSIDLVMGGAALRQAI